MQTLTSAASAIRQQKITPTELVKSALERAQAQAQFNAISYLDADAALRTAAQRTREAKRGESRGALHGVPLTVKDLYQVQGMPMSASTRAPLPPIHENEATAVSRLREAGAIIIGKANMHEIALGLTGELGQNGPTRNPHDPTRQAGGSSSGSAVCTALGVGFASLGSDTAGSIRVPAAYCGVVGFKPTYGRVPLDGALPLSWTCDHAGPLTRTVDDARVRFDVLANTRTRLTPVKDIAPRFGVLPRFLDGWLTPEVRASWDDFLVRVRRAGAKLIELEPAHFAEASACFSVIREPQSAYIHRAALESAPEKFHDQVRPFLLRGRDAKTIDYFAAFEQRARIRDGMDAVLSKCDAFLLPTAPCVAPPIGTSEVELERGRESLRAAVIRLTVPFSLCGHPCVSLPFVWLNGLPLGAQIATAINDDAGALSLARWVERAVGDRN
jgi:aspartyl-tRNA(Asn)/glutamyl-tRNA(Gln) amidotransferase subunit A